MGLQKDFKLSWSFSSIAWLNQKQPLEKKYQKSKKRGETEPWRMNKLLVLPNPPLNFSPFFHSSFAKFRQFSDWNCRFLCNWRNTRAQESRNRVLICHRQMLTLFGRRIFRLECFCPPLFGEVTRLLQKSRKLHLFRLARATIQWDSSAQKWLTRASPCM